MRPSGGDGDDVSEEEDYGIGYESEEPGLQELVAEAVHSQQLDLSSRQLQALPSSVMACAGLRMLNLSSNALAELPDQLGQLAGLRELDLSFNKLTELPHSIGELQKLEVLNVAYNQLEKLCPAVGCLDSLRILSIHDNALSSLPAALGGLARLEELKVQYNQLARLPPALGKLSSLTTLEVDGNPLPDYILSAGLANSFDVERFRAVLEAQPGAASARPGSSGRPPTAPTRPLTQGAANKPPSGCGSAGGTSSWSVAAGAPSPRPSSSVVGNFKVDMLVLDEVRAQSRVSPRSPKLTYGPADEVHGSDDDEEDRFREVEATSDGSALHWPATSPGAALPSERPSTASAVDRAEPEVMKDISDLPPAAAAVLYRSWDALRGGVLELQEGRPISRGGSVGGAGQRSSLLSGGGSHGSRWTTSTGRPGSSSHVDRPGTSSRAARPGSASSQPPRPGTASPRPGTASARPGTASRPMTASARPGTAGGPSLSSSARDPSLPSWMPSPSGISALIASSTNPLPPTPPNGGSAYQRPSTASSQRPGTAGSQQARPEHGPSPQDASYNSRQGLSAGYEAGGSTGLGFEGLPAITFPLTSGLRGMIRQMSVGEGRGDGGTSGLQGSLWGPRPGSSSSRPASRSSAGLAEGGRPSSDRHSASAGGDRDTKGYRAGASTRPGVDIDGDEDDEMEVVRQLLMSRNPELLNKFDGALEGEEQEEEDGD